MAPKAIPDRWIPYKACGEVIEGTRFICFKVPLKRSVQSNVREIEKIWDVPTVLADIPKLGAVIDLTNTARYYNPMDFLNANILHRKILMPGRIIPPESSVKEFVNAVDEFLAKDSELLIGVHCTHGLNRTGYMVCRYMRDKLGVPAQEAITKFEAARGYKMERDIYINDLLGTKNKQANVGQVNEVVPVHNRRNHFTYKSPLDDDRDSPIVDNSRRFGTRSNSDRYGSNRQSNHNSNRTNNNNGLFSCYTDRYQEWNPSGRSDRRTNGSPLSWRNRGERSGDAGSSRSSRADDNRHNIYKREDRSRTRDQRELNKGCYNTRNKL